MSIFSRRKVRPREASAFSGWLSGLRRRDGTGAKRWGIKLAIFAAVAVGVVVSMKLMERSVLRGPMISAVGCGGLRFKSCPAWMPQVVAEQITASLSPPQMKFNDKGFSSEIYRLAKACPWIKEVRGVRKHPTADPRVGVVVIDAVFRKPLARVRAPGGYAYFDAAGVRLPAGQVAKLVAKVRTSADLLPRQLCFLHPDHVPERLRTEDIHYILIYGLGEAPPVGRRWEGPEVADALRLVRLVSSRPYANQITVVDVRNHGGRINEDEPFIRMFAQAGRGQPTDIRFGRFRLDGSDFEVSAERKISYLDEYVADHGGRLAGLDRYLDLRYDELHVGPN